jgi:peptidoglycan/xylan/chitin deacetylase (PgdA/CDA1 family)
VPSRRNSNRVISINYHFLRTEGSHRFALRAHEKPDRFQGQLEQLAKTFRFCQVRDLADPTADPEEPRVAITFDDGAKDVILDVAPLLEKARATASIFVCSQPLLDGKLLGVQKIEFLMHKLGVERFRDAFYSGLARLFPGEIARGSLAFAGDYRFYRYDDEPIRKFKLDLNYQLPYEFVVPVIDAIFEQTFGPGSEAEAIRETYMDRDDLKRLVDLGFELGSHSHSHRVLPRLEFSEQKREIATAIDFVQEISGETRSCVSYPCGFYDDDTHRAMGDLDALIGLSMERRAIASEDVVARYAMPRYDVNDCFDRASNEMLDEVVWG